MKKAAHILYVLQLVAIMGAIVSGHEFIDFDSGTGLARTIGFFFPAILGAILEYFAVRKEEKAASSNPKPANTPAANPNPAPAEAKASSSAKNSSTTPSVVYDADSSLYATRKSVDASSAAGNGKKFCPYCGAKLIAKGAFCTSCGKKLD